MSGDKIIFNPTSPISIYVGIVIINVSMKNDVIDSVLIELFSIDMIDFILFLCKNTNSEEIKLPCIPEYCHVTHFLKITRLNELPTKPKLH